MSLPRTLIVMRHGRTEWNHSGRAQGHTDIQLDEVGHAQARAAAAVLATYRPERLWSSDLMRARQSVARLVEATGVEAVELAALREFDVGERSGLTSDEFEAKFPDEHGSWLAGGETLTVPGAESTSQVRARIVPALRECLEALEPGGTGVVVTHGAALRVGVAGLLGWSTDVAKGLGALDNGGWLRLREHPRSQHLQLVSYNESATAGS